MTKEEYIDDLINRYFEATTTDAEERRLKELLADPATRSTEAVEEARAVMGFTALERSLLTEQPEKKAHVMPLRWGKAAIGAAAALAAIAVGWSYLSTSQQPQTECTIYAQGRVIESEEAALAIMHSQLEAIGKAQSDNPTTDALNLLEVMITDE